MIKSKVDRAKHIIVSALEKYRSPVVYSSFGKDSMVMLDLVKKVGSKLPILFHREPFCPVKYQFANRVIEKNNYSVYDYPPASCSLISNEKHLEIVNWHRVGNKYLYMPTGTHPIDKGELICGYKDVFLKPKGDFLFPWDLCLIGQKASDADIILADDQVQAFNLDLTVNPGSADFLYPLRMFTDEDIWQYIEEFGVEFDTRRYDKENGYREFDDKTHNPDYFPICARCIDRRQPSSVWCPKLGMEISNISDTIPYSDPKNILQGPPTQNKGR